MVMNSRKQAKKYKGHAIIPAAGLGTRMGSPPQGKEMLIDPITKERVIDWSIKLALENKLLPIIAVSSKKLELRHYIRTKYPMAYVVQVNHVNEWPDTVLAVSEYWHAACNVLILPDTRFNPTALSSLLTQSTEISYAVHTIDVPAKYGIVRALNNCIVTAEKPGSGAAGTLAWGLIKWTTWDSGQKIFDTYRTKGKWIKLLTDSVSLVRLEWFRDITRNGIVLPW